MNPKKLIIIICAVIALLGAGITLLLIQSQDKTPDNQSATANFDPSDENTAYTAASKNIDLSSYEPNSTIKINAGGEYILTGKLANGQILVETGDEQKVQLYLNNAHITNLNGSAIYVRNAKKTIITLNEGTTNTITDGAKYTNLDTNGEPNAAIFSHDDLTINGTGSLTLTANYANGIESRDDLKITGGSITISAPNQGLIGNDSLEIKTATINITAEVDTIHTDGDIIIESGTFTLNAGDDAIHANNTLTINGGTIYITQSYEGIEAANVIITGGTIDITADDDGINGAGGNDNNSSSPTTPTGHNRPQDNFSKTTGTITIKGGAITIAPAQSGNGDGLDSNGDITITGGDLIIKTPATSRDYEPIDYDGTFTMTGGRIRILNPNGTYSEVTQDNISNFKRR